MPEVIAELSAEPAAGGALAAGWWARGLTLAERCALPDPPPVPAELDERTARRLQRWRERHRLAEPGRFGRRLAAAGLTEASLGALMAEDPRRLAGRTGRPDWAELAEAALAWVADHDGLVPDPPAVDESRLWEAGFALVTSPFVEVAADRFGSAAARHAAGDLIEVDVLRRGLADGLGRQLALIAARTLVLELNVLRVTGRLVGTTPAERFWAFVRHFTRPAGFAALLAEYPVLARLLAQAAALAVEVHLELLDRLAEDRDAIVAGLFEGADPGRLVEAAFGRGDQHGRGRSVALLRFTSGARLVYKPRPMAMHAHFNEVAGWFDEKTADLALPTLAVLDRGGYGWVEFVEHRPCANRCEVERYYRRLGLLLALLYALDCCDVHYENLIASGEHPVLVDLETVLHPLLPPPGGAPAASDDPADRALDRSVTRINLLPRITWSEDGAAAFDLSGVGGDSGNPMPVRNPTWAGAGTDEMRLVRENTPFPGSQNRPTLDGVEVEPGEFTAELLAGFRSAYDAIVEHRDELVELLRRFAGDESRVLLRATMTYGRLLTESTHPDVMRDALDRDRAFDGLWALSAGDPLRESAVPSEIADLWHGDVPIFTTRPGSTRLVAGDGRELPTELDAPALKRAVDKVGSMGRRDRQTQEWIIRGTLATRSAGVATVTTAAAAVPTATAGPDPSRALAAARGIADRLADTAYVEGGRASWLGLTLANQSQWTVRPLSFDLFNGYPGVALFLGQLAKVTGGERYAELARAALAPVPRLVDGHAELVRRCIELSRATLADPGDFVLTAGLRPPFGAFDGLSGLAYALVLLDGVLDAADVAGWVAALVGVVEATMAGDDALDVIGGSAGCLGAMLAVHEATGLEAAARVARACANRLAEAALPQPGGVGWRTTIEASQPLTGFSHGAAGIGWALLRYAATGGDRSHAELGRAAFGYERAAHRQAGSWPDFRVLPTTQFGGGQATMHAWCHGAPGIGLARADSLRRTADPALAEDLDLALEDVLATGPLVSQCLCHGELGNLELLTTAAAAGRADLAAERDRRAALVLDALDEKGPVCGTPGGLATPGLMTGLAGIGHGLLRIAFPDQVPAVLLLEPPATT